MLMAGADLRLRAASGVYLHDFSPRFYAAHQPAHPSASVKPSTVRTSLLSVRSAAAIDGLPVKTKAAPYGRQSFTNHSEDVTNTLKEWVESIRTGGGVQAFCSAC
jgi:hypothetical protein